MKDKLYLWLLFMALFAIILFFTLTRSDRVTDLYKAYLHEPIPQDTNERIWREIQFEKHGVSEEFISSSHMRYGQDGYIYVADNNEMVVKQFDSDGNQISVYGEGEGRGPGEFLTIIDILLDQSGDLWVLDDRNSRVTIFNTDDREDWKLMDFPEMFNKVIPVGNDEYWLEKRFDIQLKKYTLTGDHIGDVEPIVDDPTLWSFVLEGFYALTPNSDVVQSQYYTNKFVKYSREGKVSFFRKPVNYRGLPKIDPYYANEVGTMNTVDFNSRVQISMDPQVTNGQIHLYVFQKNSNGQWQPGFIDVYDLDSGDYMFSYELPERVESLAISENYLAVISEELGKLVIWKMD